MAIKKHVLRTGKILHLINLGNEIKDLYGCWCTSCLILLYCWSEWQWTSKSNKSLYHSNQSVFGIDKIFPICDGPSFHFAIMLNTLGADLKVPYIRPYFLNTLDKEKKIYVFLDVSDMLKLITKGTWGGGDCRDMLKLPVSEFRSHSEIYWHIHT